MNIDKYEIPCKECPRKTNGCWKRCIAYARMRYYLINICAPKHSKAYTEMSTELIHKDANRYDILDKIKADEDYNPCKDCPDMSPTCYQKCVEYYLYRSEFDRYMTVKKIRKSHAESLRNITMKIKTALVKMQPCNYIFNKERLGEFIPSLF